MDIVRKIIEKLKLKEIESIEEYNKNEAPELICDYFEEFEVDVDGKKYTVYFCGGEPEDVYIVDIDDKTYFIWV